MTRSLDDQGLAGDHLARPVTGMDGGDVVLAQPFDQVLTRVVGIDGAQFGLDGTGAL